jgi:deoxyribonuclease V
LAQIPRGRVTTYGDLADALGARTAARWVGEYLRDHPHAIGCCCHRVVRKGGALGLFVRDRSPIEKARLLQGEGVCVANESVVDFDECLVSQFESGRPLAKLVELQHQFAKRVRLQPREVDVRFAAGLDVSYSNDRMATGACAVVEADTGRLVWSTVRRRRVELPYIPGLLTFRELPLLLELFEESRRQEPRVDVFFVDGNGILHPRGAGVAASFGVAADITTIGVAKSLLCGRLLEDDETTSSGRAVVVGDKVVGMAIKKGARGRPIYVSPGQYIDVASATAITLKFQLSHRLPEPIYWADRLSRAAARG